MKARWNPRWITFTGLDEYTDIKRVRDLSAKYPIEWGILFGGEAVCEAVYD